MQHTARKRRKQKHIVDIERFPHRLQLYKGVPTDEISLEEFERFAVDRLKLMREIENLSIRFKRGSDEYKVKIKEAIKEFFPYYFKGEYTDSEDKEKKKPDEYIEQHINERKKDYLSHFILRLAFARSEDLRRWFLSQEMELFRFRFLAENRGSVNDFLKRNELLFNALEFDQLEDTEAARLKSCLDETSKSTTYKESENKNTDFYKVPFTDVLDLVKSRRVYIHKGYAYVPHQELVSIITGIYRSQLSQALTLTSRRLPYLEEDTRLLPMLKNLSSAYIGDSYASKKTTNSNKLALSEMDESAKISFPLCMRTLHEGMRKDHHLKHFGRLQYGLFLKAAGLSLEEALIFWRTEFTKIMDVDKFEKQYAYNVRHSFGKEGKRADYTPFSCLKIITTNQPGPGDFHGCPFKHSDSDVLKRRLQSYKVPGDNIHEIIDLVKRQHFQVACSRYFEATHKQADGTASVSHPNQYFDDSRKVLNGGKTQSSVSTPIVKKERSMSDKTIATPDKPDSKTDASTLNNVNDITMEDFGEEMEVS